MTIKIVFMGSPDFALPTLRALAHHYEVVGVVTQPDKPSGRGQVLAPPPVKQLALELGLPVMQPVKLREPESFSRLEAWAPDMIVVAAFGQILRQNVLDLPRWGCINVHASLLPRWRGAAPIQACIVAGDAETGVTIMKMDAGVDTGAMLSQRATPIQADDTAGSLSDRLAEMGASLLLDTLPDWLAGKLTPQAQDDSRATRAAMLKKEDGLLDLSQPAVALERRVRGFAPWPGTYILWQDQPFKIHRAHVAQGSARPGLRMEAEGLPALGTGDGLLVLDEVQPAGKRPMTGKDFLRGARGWTE
ncbi:MAG TPA: methionyl-tRNA formyltransferase [Anaerolineaceae bacterium]|nr:methionyl-tRNA formyltransferase [Anaerolineaceae bacterium]HPN50189.1 methionyl-tRNA formyltransferase [Anaerolineaceae bacterium]